MNEFFAAVLEVLKAVLFGIVEGVTEWLPISSTGHLILLNEFIRLDVSDEFYKMFEVVIQLGAILAVVVLYFHKLNPFSPKKDEKQKARTWNLWFKVAAAVLPSVVLGLLLDDWMDAHLYNGWVVAMALIAYGAGFIWVEQRNEGVAPKIKSVYALDYRTAVLIGCFQCLALVPGTSRSGATILGAILLGVSRSAAAEFSFFLGIPTMLGASLLKVVGFLKSGAETGFTEILVLLVGCIVSFVVSLLVIKALMDYVRRHSFSLFGMYRIVLGVIVLIYFTGKLFWA